MRRELRISWVSVIAVTAGVAAVALIGSYFSSMNRDWYEQLNKPAWQPPNWAFPIAWNTIFLLSIVSLVMIWNSRPRTGLTYWATGVAALNGVLNVFWSYLFFGNRLILPAVYDAGLLLVSVLVIMILAWPISRLASLLFLPYAAWTFFATYLTRVVYELNR